MADKDAFAVSDLVIRQTPILTSLGRTSQTTTVQFRVGDHGPFVFTYAEESPNAAKITADVTAKVNELRSLAQAIGSLNQSTRG